MAQPTERMQPAPQTYEDYVDAESRRYAEANYSTGTGQVQQQAWQPAPVYAAEPAAPAPSQALTSYQPELSDPYHTGNAYSTGPDNPFGVWRPRRLPPPTPALRNEWAALENARYNETAYALGNAYSTSQAYAGPTSSGNPAPENPMAWNTELARQAGAPPPVAPLEPLPPYGQRVMSDGLGRGSRQAIREEWPDGWADDPLLNRSNDSSIAWPSYDPQGRFDGMRSSKKYYPWYGSRDYFKYPEAIGPEY